MGQQLIWKLIFLERGGHRVFRAECPGSGRHGQLCIADGSGATPDDTDDGRLWLAHVGRVEAGKGGFVIRAESTAAGEDVSVLISPALAYWLVNAKGWFLHIAIKDEIQTGPDGVATVIRHRG